MPRSVRGGQRLWAGRFLLHRPTGGERDVDLVAEVDGATVVGGGVGGVPIQGMPYAMSSVIDVYMNAVAFASGSVASDWAHARVIATAFIVSGSQ